MTKSIKAWLLLFVVIAIAIFSFNALKAEENAQAGYDLYQQGESEAAFEKFTQTAESDPQSAYALAMMYMDGIGTQPNETEAESWLIKSAQANNRNALFNLGYYRYNQTIPDTTDDINGLTSLTKAADMGLVDAQEMIGGIYLSDKNDIVPQDVELARKYFTLAADQDSKLAKFALGLIAYEYDKNYKKAVDILTPLVSKDFPLPAMVLSSIYQQGGYGVTQNKIFAERYKNIFFSASLDAISDLSDLEPVPLSVYGFQTAEDKQNILMSLENRAAKGEPAAIYALYDKYMFGKDVPKSQYKALSYLKPLVEKKDPEALYLNYVATKSNLQDLIDSADANYANAAYLLYQVYSGQTFDSDIKRDDDKANKYLTAAADLGHFEALVKIVSFSVSDYDFPTTQLVATVEKYTPILEEKYPNSPQALIVTSGVYNHEETKLYSPEKSFELLNKAYKLSPSYNTQISLAQKYLYGAGTPQNLEKAVKLLQQAIEENGYNALAEGYLVQAYYRFDIKAYVDEKQIIAIIKKKIDDSSNYQYAHYYADYLLKQDAEKNKDIAFDLYKKAGEYDDNARIYHALALLKYQPEEQSLAVDLVAAVLNSPRANESLSDEERKRANHVILQAGLANVDGKDLLVRLSIFEKNSDAQKIIEPLIGSDADITYLYNIKKLTQVGSLNKLTDDEIKPFYDGILNAAELGSQQASLYIIQNLDAVNYINDKPYDKKKFQRVTKLTTDDLIPRYQQCAALGSNRCLYNLGEIYQEGKYGIDANYDTALSYYNQISDPDYSFLKSRLREIEKGKASFIKIQADAKNNDPDALRTLAQAYKYGNYGQPYDEAKWLKYLTQSAKYNNETSLEELIDYYSDDSRIDANKRKILGFYDQLAAIGSKNYTRELAHQYINGSRLVDVDRAKAREYYEKAGSWGDQYLGYMNKFDIAMKTQNESATAKFTLADAYYNGYGVKKDIPQALKYYQAASDEGNDRALRDYSRILYLGIYDEENKAWIVEPNWDEAIVLLKKYSTPSTVEQYINIYNTLVVPAQNGDKQAYVKLGDWYAESYNNEAAKIWYRKSIDAGDLRSYEKLDGVTKDQEERRQNFLAGIKQGDDFSQVSYARKVIFDNTIPTDSEQYATAIIYLEDGLKSPRGTVSENAYSVLSQLYARGMQTDDYVAFREKQPAKYIALIESESSHRNEALRDLYYYYADSDFEKALGYMKAASDKGDLAATFKLYEIYSPGEYCSNSKRTNIEQSEMYLNLWLERGNFPKTTNNNSANDPERLTSRMGDIFFDGDCGIPRDFKKAIAWYKTSLKYNDEYALNRLYKVNVEYQDATEAYYYGKKLGKSDDDIDLSERLAPDVKQQVNDVILQENEYLLYGQYEKEIEEKRQKAEAGDKYAAFTLAINYARGERVHKDTNKMLYYYELAGKNGLPRAYNRLGGFYRKGNVSDIPKDPQKALYFYDLGAKLNDSDNAHLAGDMLYLGQGLEKDYPRAANYYEMTNLEQGEHHGLAKYKLAYMYYNGLVGTKSDADIQKAYDNLELAAKYQYKDAITALKKWDFSQINK